MNAIEKMAFAALAIIFLAEMAAVASVLYF